MIPILQAFFRWYPVKLSSIQSIIHSRSYLLLSVLLKRSKHKERRIILEVLAQNPVSFPYLNKLLVQTIKKDSLKNAILAEQILELNIINDPRLEQRLKEAKLILTERKRRWENKIKSSERYELSSSKSMVDKKAKMQQLHRVKQQLKKGIRLH